MSEANESQQLLPRLMKLREAHKEGNFVSEEDMNTQKAECSTS